MVKKAETQLAKDVEAEIINHEYVSILGLESFSTNATRMLLGSESKALKDGRAFGVQSLGGTGALSNGGNFLTKQLGKKICYVSDPTWINHELLFKTAGFQEVRRYRYWKKDTR